MKRTLAATLATLVLAACGLGQRTRQAESIHESRDHAIEASTATGFIDLEVTLDAESEALEGLPPGARTFSLSAAVAMDLAGDTARLVLGAPVAPSLEGLIGEPPPAAEPPDPDADPDIVFSAESVFVRRSNLRPTERRVWAQLDYAALPDEEQRLNLDELGGTQILLATMATLDPKVILDLVVGALAGSVERGEPTQLDGVEVTPFEANLSIDRSITELDLADEELEPRLLRFRLLGLFDDVRPARYWLDADGRLRRLEADLAMAISRQREHELTVTLRIAGYGTPVAIDVPGAEETITFERHGRLVRTLAPEGA